MRNTPFVDAHVHFWDLKATEYPWLTPPFASDGLMGSVEAIASNYSPIEYAKDARNWNIAGLVHIDAGAAPEYATNETRWLDGLISQHNAPSGIIGFANLMDPNLHAVLDAHSQSSAFRGIRQIVNYHPNPYRTYTPTDLTLNDAWKSGFAQLAKYGLSFDLQAFGSQFPALSKFFAEHDAIPIMINHAGMPFHDEYEDWQKGMKALASLPQCSVKISGFGITDHNWNKNSIHPYITELIDLFSPDRVMFASDFPTDKLYADFDTCLSAYAEIIQGFSNDEKRNMWGRNANKLYRLGLPI
ncbi:amidohydrolase family protein [Hirschia baltica]|uniref:Amidohydrolase 2 n=1 Tax=Hirschia baltica (strain ATCC 49814 / DSM 5838 / IFAM 1418) TaxID=582402 RepID=C6XQD3_HIRBI|nr:amidohydrolase family protein [Hirschia baltica]ACT60432.1 amidohydrolase 2 [Hirschia baltica ATCC 49814]